MSKLKTYLTTKKIDPRRLLVTSKALESLEPEDRKIVRAKRLTKSGKATDSEKELAAKERRSGRPVTGPTLARALAGEAISGAAKTRILHAVNKVLTTKKQAAATLRDLF